MIHVSFATSNVYAKFAGTAMLSMFENTKSEIAIHILHDNTLTQDNRNKFTYIASQYNQTVNFYNVEELCIDKIAKIYQLMAKLPRLERLTMAAFYRTLLPDVISNDIKQMIYLDSDIVVNLDIQELWQIELADKPLAAVTQLTSEFNLPKSAVRYIVSEGFVKLENYFNSGVLLINLEILRNEWSTIEDGMRFISNHKNGMFSDQDVLNYCYSEKFLKLPAKFNQSVIGARRLINARKRPAAPQQEIYHYYGQSLGLDARDIFNKLFFKYFAKTPFLNENTIGNLYEGVRQLYIDQKSFAIKVSMILSGKTRAFLVSPNMANAIKQIFHVKAEEELIVAKSSKSLQQMANSIVQSNHTKVFFVIVNGYPNVSKALIDAGFTENVDFVNGMEFLSDANGVPLKTNPLVKLL